MLAAHLLALHGVGLTSAGLTVGNDCRIVAFQARLDRGTRREGVHGGLKQETKEIGERARKLRLSDLMKMHTKRRKRAHRAVLVRILAVGQHC